MNYLERIDGMIEWNTIDGMIELQNRIELIK